MHKTFVKIQVPARSVVVTVPITYLRSFCSYKVRSFVYRWYFYRILLVRKKYYVILSHIVFFILQLMDWTIQTNDHAIWFGEDVAVIWHGNILLTKNYRISHTV